MSIRKDMGTLQADIARADAVAGRMVLMEKSLTKLADAVAALSTKVALQGYKIYLIVTLVAIIGSGLANGIIGMWFGE